MKQKYRMLGPDEKPDYRKGDQFHIEKCEWDETNCRGQWQVSELRKDDRTARYRRPVDEQGKDLK